VESVWINGKNHLLEGYILDSRRLDNLPVFEKEILSFIIEWMAGKDIFHLKSSGSTGTPKEIILYRDQMILSAESTLDFLGIPAGGKALLCLDPRYVAGKMVIIRSITGDLDLYAIDPKSNPLSEFDPGHIIDLASFVPYQIAEILEESYSLKKFRSIYNVLIGGAMIPPQLESQLGTYENKIFHTFGMTETVSHIALRPLSGMSQSPYFKVLPGISIGRDERGCLIVEGKITGGKKLITNDLVEIVSEKEFEWKGRIDQVINTGGIIVNINLLEIKVREILQSLNIHNDFFIDHIADEKLGDKIVMILESGYINIDIGSIKETFKKQLSKFEIPRVIQVVQKFSRTDTGKINRKLIMGQIPGS
jgi:O-succinylbenzoic acid--CoA ligase